MLVTKVFGASLSTQVSVGAELVPENYRQS